MDVIMNVYTHLVECNSQKDGERGWSGIAFFSLKGRTIQVSLLERSKNKNQPNEQITPASSECPQLWVPTDDLLQWKRSRSVPWHTMSSIQIRPRPWLKYAEGFGMAFSLSNENYFIVIY